MTGREMGRGWIAAAALAVGLSAALGASEKRPVPAFAMTMLDGTTTDGAATLTGGTFVVVYIAPGSEPSERLVRALKSWDSEALRARTMVILGTGHREAQQWAAAAGAELLPVRYAVDERGDIRRALRLTGAPHLFGTANGQIEWAISGVLNDPRMLESVVRTWLARP